MKKDIKQKCLLLREYLPVNTIIITYSFSEDNYIIIILLFLLSLPLSLTSFSSGWFELKPIGFNLGGAKKIIVKR